MSAVRSIEIAVEALARAIRGPRPDPAWRCSDFCHLIPGCTHGWSP